MTGDSRLEIGLFCQSCSSGREGSVAFKRGVPLLFLVDTITGLTMQQSTNDVPDPCSAMDDYLLGDILQKIVNCKVDCLDLVDFAHQLAMETELSNGNVRPIVDSEPSICTDWQLCDRLLPDDSLPRDEAQQCLLSAGYTDCMDEAIRFLVEEEDMGPEHPLVRNLKAHLEEARDRVLSAACDSDLDNNNINRTPCAPQGLPYEFWDSYNSILSNTG